MNGRIGVRGQLGVEWAGDDDDDDDEETKISFSYQADLDRRNCVGNRCNLIVVLSHLETQLRSSSSRVCTFSLHGDSSLDVSCCCVAANAQQSQFSTSHHKWCGHTPTGTADGLINGRHLHSIGLIAGNATKLRGKAILREIWGATRFHRFLSFPRDVMDSFVADSVHTHLTIALLQDTSGCLG